ncbi:receptor-type tyrosine-protein phosphatase O-like [Lethenteron reissneri]|uniref:receptor-type tyrosine-protein phosphatase O-like n=1 Tax=Lethenteron reissneri TaxID=7753 RepID=UPI002AB74CAD|nr:receptor-type tyrosine-protein phosphatase O-like [Lethenteron reissneri]
MEHTVVSLLFALTTAVIVFAAAAVYLLRRIYRVRDLGYRGVRPRGSKWMMPKRGRSVHLKIYPITSPVKLVDFERYYTIMSRDSGYLFSLQFEVLNTMDHYFLHSDACLPENKHKNRYDNILPRNYGRVRLKPVAGVPGSDYINAEFIPGVHGPKSYIATQGPLPETQGDFWRMLWEHRVRLVVMLTQCVERMQTKCSRYWPEKLGSEEHHGAVSVRALGLAKRGCWELRTFLLRSLVNEQPESRVLWHYHFTAWPDKGVPLEEHTGGLVDFAREVRKKSATWKAPIVVHCSAGVGRTGTFIALDRVLHGLQTTFPGAAAVPDECSPEGPVRAQAAVDLLALVAELRRSRVNMVQTEEQFVFLHRCILYICRHLLNRQQRDTDICASGTATLEARAEDVEGAIPLKELVTDS